jgi:hypothetical protein
LEKLNVCVVTPHGFVPTGAVKFTTAPHDEGSLFTEIFPGQVIAGHCAFNPASEKRNKPEKAMVF